MQKERNLKQIYISIVETLRNVMDIDEKLSNYKTLEYGIWTDNEFFESLTRAIFTGIKNNIITERWTAITEAFSKFEINRVAKYTEKDVKRLMKNPKVIKHEVRIRAVIDNAKKMQDIIKEYGSFANYISSFPSIDDLIWKLQGYYGGFKGIGEINVYEFVKEIGLPFIKPDRQVRRVFLRLGLIDEETSPDEIVHIGKAMAEEVKEKPGAIDCAIWYFGQKICKIKPECGECSLVSMCKYPLL